MAKKKRRTTKRRAIKHRRPMATRPRKKRRTSVRRHLSAAPKRRRRRRRGLSAGLSKAGFTNSLKLNFGGSLGGGAYLAARMIPMNPWLRTGIGFGVSILTAMFVKPDSILAHGAAGLAGASTYAMGERLMPVGMLHDDMQDASYVDADTLMDSGKIDEYGNSVLCDNDGVLYRLNDEGDLEAIADAYSLNDGSSIPGVSMYENLGDPISPFALSAGNSIYNLAEGY